MKGEERQELIEDEWLIVRHSGEIPEIALTSVIYYLTGDSDGPGLQLTKDELNYLRDGAKERYYEIVLRDLEPENRDKTIYRGVKRTIYNFHRFRAFCRRQGFDPEELRQKTASAFLSFICCEVANVTTGDRQCCLNASYEELIAFSNDLGIAGSNLPPALREICC